MKGFKLLDDLRKWNRRNTSTIPSTSTGTPPRDISATQTSCHWVPLIFQTSRCSNVIGIPVSKDLQMLSQDCKPASKEFSQHICANVREIQGTFLTQNSGHNPKLFLTFRIHKRQDNKTTKPKFNLKARPNHPQLGLIFFQTLGINENYRARIQDRA